MLVSPSPVMPSSGVDEYDRLDGGESRAVPHGHWLMFAESGKRDADVAGSDVGDFHGL